MEVASCCILQHRNLCQFSPANFNNIKNDTASVFQDLEKFIVTFAPKNVFSVVKLKSCDLKMFLNCFFSIYRIICSNSEILIHHHEMMRIFTFRLHQTISEKSTYFSTQSLMLTELKWSKIVVEESLKQLYYLFIQFLVSKSQSNSRYV